MPNYQPPRYGSSNHANKNKIEQKLNEFTDRDLAWTANYICLHEPIGPKNISPNNVKSNLIDILQKLSNEKMTIDFIIEIKRHSIIADSYFDWLRNDYRAQVFTYSLLVKNYDGAHHDYRDIFYTYDPLGYIYWLFDTQVKFYKIGKNATLVNDISDKQKLIQSIQRKWLSIIKNDKYTAWVNESDNEREDWIYKHLVRTSKILSTGSAIVIDHNKKTELILASLDAIGIEQLAIQDYEISQAIIDSRKISIDKIKRAWSQKKYNNAGKTKRPYHLPLTKISRERLKKMATIEKKSDTAKLNELINFFYESEYINPQGNDIF
ncbi:hypothetical protein [Psychrobacter proteolyticus]|uniref:Uncharacterized protein n=1 Tax=Psychrobacter proteolyticus TaxID=147825 RepID=A0ABV0DA98_9GAMM